MVSGFDTQVAGGRLQVAGCRKIKLSSPASLHPISKSLFKENIILAFE
jgi:hypothetical protein